MFSGNTETDGLLWTLTDLGSSVVLLGLGFPDFHTGTEFFDGRLVVYETDTIQVTTSSFSGSSNCDWYIGGYELLLP